MLKVIAGAAKGLAVLAGWGSGLCAALGLAGLLNPWPDIFSHFNPIWAATGLFAVLLGAILRSRQAVIAGLIGIVLAACLIVPELISVRDQPVIANRALRIVQFNIYEGNVDPPATAAWIIAQNPDVVVLQEADGIRGAERVVAALRQRFPYSPPCSVARCEVLIMSARPPTAAAEIRGPIAYPKPAGSWMTVDTPGGPASIVGLHIRWPVQPDLQEGQMQALAQALRALPRERRIITGDMNMAAWSNGLRRLGRVAGEPRLTRAMMTWPVRPWAPAQLGAWSRWGPWNLPFAYMPIDHVFAGTGWSAVAVRPGPTLGSDHLPVVIDLAAPSEASPAGPPSRP